MDPALKSALSQPSALLFSALKIQMPDHTIRLVDGSAALTIGGELYTGQDNVFGTIADASEIAEEIGDSAPEWTVSFFPPDVSATAALSHPSMQGSPVQLMAGACDPISGIAIGAPEIMFLGEIDVPTIRIDQKGGRMVEFTVVSVFERMFEVEEGQRASNGWHQSIWPGELGLEHMTGTDVNLYWGASVPKSNNLSKGWMPGAAVNTSNLRAGFGK